MEPEDTIQERPAVSRAGSVSVELVKAVLDFLRGLQRIAIVLWLAYIVGNLASAGAEWVQTAIAGAFGVVIGFLFGERARSKADG